MIFEKLIFKFFLKMEKYNDIENDKTNLSNIDENTHKIFETENKIKLIILKNQLEEKKNELYVNRLKLRKNENNNMEDFEKSIKTMIGVKNVLKIEYEKLRDNYENQKIKKTKKKRKLANLNEKLKNKLKSWRDIQNKTSEKNQINNFFNRIKNFF